MWFQYVSLGWALRAGGRARAGCPHARAVDARLRARARPSRNRPKPETLQRKALERKAAKHGAKGTRGAKRLDAAGSSRGGGKGSGGGKSRGSSGFGGEFTSGSSGKAFDSSRRAFGPSKGGRGGGGSKPKQRQAKFK